MAWQPSAAAAAQEALARFEVPGMVIAASIDGGPIESLALGVDAQGASLNTESILPVASITKLAVALGLLRLVGRGEARLDDPLSHYLPAARSAVEGVTLRTLLCHTAGAANDLEPGSAPYGPSLTWSSMRQPLLDTPPALPPGRQVLYSSLGVGLQALVIETVTGSDVHAYLSTEVFAPLGAEAWLGTEPPRLPAPITGDLGEHAGTDLEPFNSRFYRSVGFPWGGMVATAEAAVRLVRAFAGIPEAYLPESLRVEATRDQTGGLAGGFAGWMEWAPCPWGLGVEIKGVKRPHFTPPNASAATYGHIGWSGAATWHDPQARVAWAIVGARTWGPWCSRMVDIGQAIVEEAAPGRREHGEDRSA